MPLPPVEPKREPPRTYKRRAGRVTSGQADARERLWTVLGVDIDGSPLHLPTLFGRTSDVVVEIGFGMGEATVAMAAAQPDLDVLAVDVHRPGQGALLRAVDEQEVTNLRVGDGDALILLREMLAPGSLHGVRVLFPDPWPKRRHWKRRLVGPGFADVVASRLAPGGWVHVATDSAPYAEQARDVFGGHPLFALTDDVPWRVCTRFEEQAIAAGRPAYDVAAVRLAIEARR